MAGRLALQGVYQSGARDEKAKREEGGKGEDGGRRRRKVSGERDGRGETSERLGADERREGERASGQARPAAGAWTAVKPALANVVRLAVESNEEVGYNVDSKAPFTNRLLCQPPPHPPTPPPFHPTLSFPLSFHSMVSPRTLPPAISSG